MSKRTWEYNDRENGTKSEVFGVLNDVFEAGNGLSKSEKLAYIYLSSVQEWNVIDKSIRVMSKESGLASATLQNAIKKLITESFITKDEATKTITLERDMEFAKKGGYFVIHFSVFEDMDILQTKEAKLVYAFLSRKSMRNTQEAEPSVREIMEACNIGEKKTKEALEDLENASLITVQKRNRITEEGQVWHDRHLFTLLEVPDAFTGEEEIVEEKQEEVVVDIKEKKENAFAGHSEDKETTNNSTTSILNENEEEASEKTNNLEVDERKLRECSLEEKDELLESIFDSAPEQKEEPKAENHVDFEAIKAYLPDKADNELTEDDIRQAIQMKMLDDAKPKKKEKKKRSLFKEKPPVSAEEEEASVLASLMEEVGA